MTSSVEGNNPSNAPMMASAVSVILLMREISIPSKLKVWPIHALLVSTICPIKISSPIVMISAFTSFTFEETKYTIHVTAYRF